MLASCLPSTYELLLSSCQLIWSIPVQHHGKLIKTRLQKTRNAHTISLGTLTLEKRVNKPSKHVMIVEQFLVTLQTETCWLRHTVTQVEDHVGHAWFDEEVAFGTQYGSMEVDSVFLQVSGRGCERLMSNERHTLLDDFRLKNTRTFFYKINVI